MTLMLRHRDITPSHADPECSAYELAAILRVHANKLAKAGNGWEHAATDLHLAADRLEHLAEDAAEYPL